MQYPRPKILTAVTVPSTGWTLKFTVSVAASLDAEVTATIAAGTYYVAWDGQSDDLLFALSAAMRAALVDGGLGTNRYPYARLNDENKVEIYFDGANFDGTLLGGGPDTDADDSLDWDDAGTSSDLAAALGFSDASADSSTATAYPLFTGDYQHAYGWYADDDGQLASLLVEDSQIIETPQAIAYGGQVKQQQLGSRFTNELQLKWLSRAQTHSRGVGYGVAPVHPYTRNVALDCWWQAARLGTRFRVYREGRNEFSTPIDIGATTAADTTTVTDSAKAFVVSPQEHAGRLLHIRERFGNRTDDAGRFLVSSHTATVFTSPAAAPDGQNWEDVSGTQTYYVLDQLYRTYVLDLDKFKKFSPLELPAIDQYEINIPLLRYVA